MFSISFRIFFISVFIFSWLVLLSLLILLIFKKAQLLVSLIFFFCFFVLFFIYWCTNLYYLLSSANFGQFIGREGYTRILFEGDLYSGELVACGIIYVLWKVRLFIIREKLTGNLCCWFFLRGNIGDIFSEKALHSHPCPMAFSVSWCLGRSKGIHNDTENQYTF